MALFGTPGLVEWLDLGVTVEIRGTLVFGDYLYEVGGDKLYRVTALGVVDELGVITTSVVGPVGMATNGLDLVVVDGTSGFVWDFAAGTFARIVDPDFPPCSIIRHIDGYYLVPKKGTGQIWRSDFNDGSSWGGLAFSTAGANPDLVVGLEVSNRDVYVIGEQTTEIWVNSGAATFNFISIQGAFIEKGMPSTFASGEGNNAVFWVARDRDGQGQVVQVVGRLPTVVSTPAITRQIQSWGDLSDIQLFVYEQVGHTHVVITSPGSDETLV